jgi:hypothetical protein
MITNEVVDGVAVAVFGLAFYAVARAAANDPGRLRTVARHSWWFDRRVVPKLRSGRTSQEEWAAHIMRNQRITVKWIFTPAVVLLLAFACYLIIAGLAGRG